MKQTQLPPPQDKFSGNLRHYHRSGGQNQSSWDAWVHGPTRKRRGSRKWLKGAAVIIGICALVAIAAGLWIEMGWR